MSDAPEPPARRASVLQDVYQRLQTDIFSFRMPPGQRYSEHELAASLGVSRTPLRFALHILAREGHLVRLEGHSSWQVQPLDLDYYADLYDFRTDIEAIAVNRLCREEPGSALASLATYWFSPAERHGGNYAAVADADERFHRTLVELAGNREMLRTFSDLTDRIRVIRRLDFAAPDRIQATFDEHAAILTRLIARDAPGAEALIRAHIGSSRRAIRDITLHHLARVTAHADPARLRPAS
jgi:DNA-binding GntR family transcriptional regulator